VTQELRMQIDLMLKNAPSDFCRIMYEVLGDLDDVVIFSRDFETHLSHIETVLIRLASRHLKINLEKCEWAQEKIKILGHIIEKDKIKMDTEKISIISEWPTPKNVTHVQKLLGPVNNYRKFIEDLAHIAAPLFRLLKKDLIWKWTDDCEAAFQLLKKKLTTHPILRQPNFEKEFMVFTDASGVAIGAILAQIDDNGGEYVISYLSRLLKGAEIHYGITEKECLAVVWAIKQLRVYLNGQKFKVIKDHLALQWIMKVNDPTGKLARWALYLQAYEFEIIYTKLERNIKMLTH
jgi:hypothetical protein